MIYISLVVGLGFAGNGTCDVLRCSVLTVVPCFRHYYTILEEVFLIYLIYVFLDFENYCFNLYKGNLVDTIL